MDITEVILQLAIKSVEKLPSKETPYDAGVLAGEYFVGIRTFFEQQPDIQADVHVLALSLAALSKHEVELDPKYRDGAAILYQAVYQQVYNQA